MLCNRQHLAPEKTRRSWSALHIHMVQAPDSFRFFQISYSNCVKQEKCDAVWAPSTKHLKAETEESSKAGTQHGSVRLVVAVLSTPQKLLLSIKDFVVCRIFKYVVEHGAPDDVPSDPISLDK